MSHSDKTIKREFKKMKGKTICRFPSSKPEPNTILTEGVLEKNFCYHLESDDNVIEYFSQPIGFHYGVDGARH